MVSSYIQFFVLKQFILIFLLEAIYSISYNLLIRESIKSGPWKRAIVDNVAHISLGIVSWLVTVSYEKAFQPWNIICCLLCGLFAGLVDIDHFLMARSFKLSDALNLPSRPPFHNTTVMCISILFFILVMYKTRCLKISYIGWILLVAVVSHHLRDSLHRGLWLWPSTHSKPIERFPCLILTYCFPLFIGVIINHLYKSHNVVVNYDYFIV